MSWLFYMKTRRLRRIPARSLQEDPAADADAIQTEDDLPIQTEASTDLLIE